MKLRTDIVKMYKEIHGWVGIISGLGLFIAFFAGAITMFEAPLQRWASPPVELAAPVSLQRTPELVRAVLAAHPEAAKDYDVHLVTGPEQPARITWEIGGRGSDKHAPPRTFYAALSADGALQVVERGPSSVAQFVDVLHQQVGIMLDHETAMPIMGAVALLYSIALVSGTIVLLPSLIKDLFAMRIGKNVKRMWLDVHNVLGLFSLPFHVVMALTAVVFAFHDQFYDAQGLTFAGTAPRPPVTAPPLPDGPSLAPAAVVERLSVEVPGFTPLTLAYGKSRDGAAFLRATGSDLRYGMRGPDYTLATLDPQTAAVTGTDYLGGRQDGWGAAITSFFALHFGSFGGGGVRWAYFALGIAGAFLFYTGNLLWVESRRKRERKAGAVTQTGATRVLGALTVGVPLGSIAGTALTIAAAKPLGLSATSGIHSTIYHLVFFAFVAWSLVRGSARAGVELLPATAIAAATIPLSTVLFVTSHPPAVLFVDLIALSCAAALLVFWNASRKRCVSGPTDSVWSATAPRTAHQA